MIELGNKRKVPVEASFGGKRKLIGRTVADEPVRVTRGVLDGHFCRDSGRKLVVKLCDGDIIELRPQGTKHRVTATLFDVYGWIMRSKALSDHMAKLRARKAEIADRRVQRRLRRPLNWLRSA